MSRRLVVEAVLIAVLTMLLLFLPALYPYAAAVGGFVIGVVLVQNSVRGLKTGVFGGFFVMPLAFMIAHIYPMTPLSGSTTGITILIESFRGMGSHGSLFSAVMAYFLGVYSMMTGGASAAIGGKLGNYVKEVL